MNHLFNSDFIFEISFWLHLLLICKAPLKAVTGGIKTIYKLSKTQTEARCVVGTFPSQLHSEGK